MRRFLLCVLPQAVLIVGVFVFGITLSGCSFSFRAESKTFPTAASGRPPCSTCTCDNCGCKN